MAMNTLGGLKDTIRDFINRTDLSDAMLTSAINVAIQRIQRQLRIPAMEAQFNMTLEAGYNQIAIAGDYLELKNITANGVQMERKSSDYISTLEQTPATPFYFTRVLGNWEVYPVPQADVEISYIYYKEFDQLVNPEDTNILLRISGDLVLWASLGFLGEYFEDARADKWNMKTQEVISELTNQAMEQEYSGSALAINHNVYY